ncbi:MAG: hypothetical protein KKC42_00980 [Candidatus Omnitrophica bacterium]|nr:hypothetical protein [Candidatus Omnitrophota bacterium]
MIIWLKFLICTCIVLFSGRCVAKYGDVIAEKTGLGGLWVGVVLVAIATSLPEIFTGVGSTLFVDAPNLTVGNLFGANKYNLLNIALLDILHKGPPLLSTLTSGQLLTAGLSLIPLFIASLGIFLSARLTQLSIANISLYSILILVVYLFCVRIIFKFAKRQQQVLAKEEALLKYDSIPLSKAYLFYAFAALAIAGAGIWLAYIGDEIARTFSLSQNFVGSLFLGFSTTLPEISVSLAALRLGAKEMAVANMLGSNLFNMVIIFINDVLYRKAPIFKVVSQEHLLNGFIVFIMTLIVIAGLILKPKRKPLGLFSSYSIILVIVFIVGAFLTFSFGIK